MVENVCDLEIQIDPLSKKILSNPERCRSALLDVTVIKPNDAFGTKKTNTLRADEVKKLITSMEKQRRDKQKIIDNLKQDNTIIKVRRHDEVKPFKSRSPYSKTNHSKVDDVERKDFIGIDESVRPLFCEIRKSLKNVENRINNMQKIDLVISETTTAVTSTDDLIYRKRKTASSTVSSGDYTTSYVYKSDTAYRHDFKDFLNKKMNDKCQKGEKVEGRCFCENCGLVGLLTECQQHPLMSELRESSPPGEIRHRTGAEKANRGVDNQLKYDPYISHLSQRIKSLEARLTIQEERSVAKDYLKKIMAKLVNSLSPRAFKKNDSENFIDKENKTKNDPCTSYDSVNCFRADVFYEQPNKDKSTLTDDDVYSANVWKWGEEILKPGIDLKNRIVTLVSDVIGKFMLAEKPESSFDKKEQSKDFSRVDSQTIRRFLEHVNSKHYNAQEETRTRRDSSRVRFRTSDCPETFPRRDYEKSRRPSPENISISINAPTSTIGKQEFINIISRARPAQKEVLWKNIWAQAQAHHQTKNDMITIKIPRPGKPEEMLETELAIREVEQVLLKQ